MLLIGWVPKEALMIKRYQSNHSNEVHQLIVTPSKHYFVTSNGTFKYQKKLSGYRE